MARPDWKRIRDVFEQALELGPGERDGYLRSACGDDAGLRREVDELLAAYERTGDFLAAPAVPTGAGATFLYAPGGAGENRHLAPGTVLEGKYRVEGLLGRGGMGEVYRATQLNLRRPVALKLMRGAYLQDPSARARFEREARAVARLKHPNLVTVHDLGVAPGVGAYIVMEYVAGRSLREELAARGRLPAGEALGLVRQVCAGVEAAHAAGVLHRDLKPENILLEELTGGTTAKVVDFGIAKLVEEVGATGEPAGGLVTAEGSVLGTPVYMAPEQCRGEAVDGRADVYALGCVLYELLTGAPPFMGPSAAAVLARHLADPVPLEPLERTGIDPDLAAAVARALAKAPAERFASAGEMADALRPGHTGRTPAGEPAWHTTGLSDQVTTNPAAPAPDTSPSSMPNNLPQAATRFVGRDRQIGEVRERLEGSRLVTLVGPGGVGKTRLALEAAWQSLGRYSDGVWLVELAPLSDPRLVAQTVATALGVRQESGRSADEALSGWLQEKQTLLVLDNCEHVIDACAALALRLLTACAGLRVLATSREALGAAGEAVCPVPPLEVPPPGGPEALDCEAVRLFVERAAFAKPGFDTAGHDVEAIAAVCRRLEGIPLAVELAAARVRVLSVEQILGRLEDRFRLLAGGGRTAPSRQQTLRATLDWSHNLLTPEERALLRRLSVFVGGWTLEAAEEVCAGAGGQGPGARDEVRGGGGVARVQEEAGREEPGSASSLTPDPWPLTPELTPDPCPLAPDGVLDGLARLIDKSLVQIEEQGHEARYRMLETVREYAFEHLRGAGEAEAVRRHHARAFLALAEAADPELFGERADEWLERLEAEHGNLRAALAWLLENDPDACLRLATALRSFWIKRGYYAEGRSWLETALGRSPAGSPVPATVRAKALRGAGEIALRQGHPPAAQAHMEESLRIGRETGDGRTIASSSMGLGFLAMTRGDLAAAGAYCGESLSIGRGSEDDVLVANSLNLLGEIARQERDWAKARALYEESLALYRRKGFGSGVSATLGNLGLIACELGDLGAASACYREALEIDQRLGCKEDMSYSLEALGALAAKQGAWELSARLAGAADALRAAIGAEPLATKGSLRERWLAEARERLGEAALGAAMAEGRAMPLEKAVERALAV